MDIVFQALGNPARREILDIVKNDPGCSVTDICKYFDVTRIAVMKHLRILEDADLLHSEKSGRVRAYYMNTIPIQMIYDRWTTEYSALWSGRMTRIKYTVESKGKKSVRARKSRVQNSNRGIDRGRVA